MNTVVLFSGGLDSSCLLGERCRYGENVTAISISYSSKHNQTEIASAKTIAKYYNAPHLIFDLSAFGAISGSSLLIGGDDIPLGNYSSETVGKTVVPFRNGFLLSVAIAMCQSLGGGSVYLGCHIRDQHNYPDCRPDFIASMNKAALLATEGMVLVKAPYVNKQKWEIVKLSNDLGFPLELTWSCYRGGSLHCGKCPACNERVQAFSLANVPDPTIYEA